MSIARIALVLGALSTVPSALQAQTTVAGSTPANFRVTESGAAEYRVPIQIPPGIAGMEPKLALVYNSQAGNGLLGVGWNLEGLSSITRCPRTKAQDGARGGVNYDSNDRYCLDGQRLILVSSPPVSYGDPGAEYRTERESFSKVISNGVAGNGPAWFKVWTKSGQILEYGNTADSQIEAQGKPTVRVWAVNKVSDTKGSYFTVTYSEDNPNGDFFPSRIDYTGNVSNGALPSASARFFYQLRPDPISHYRAGSVSRVTNRLVRVEAYVGNVLNKKYTLQYPPDAGTPPRSQLTSITECDGGSNCRPPVTLAWGPDPGAYPAAQGGQLEPGNRGDEYVRLTGDFNGDGITDLAWSYSGVYGFWAFTALGKGDGTFHPAQGGQLDASDRGPYYVKLTGDFNGDGITDLAWSYSGVYGFWAFTALGKGDGTFYPPQGGQLEPNDRGNFYTRLTGDFNGDGITDLVWSYSGPYGFWAFTALGKGDGTFYPAQGGQLDATHRGEYYQYEELTGDFNGDGITDLAWSYNGFNGFWAFTALGKGDGTFHPIQGGQLEPNNRGEYYHYTKLVDDFNGDGISDLAWSYNGANGFWAFTALGKGDGTFFPAQGGQLEPNNRGEYYHYAKLTGDFNGDGITDLAWSYNGTNGFWAFTALGKGDGTFYPAQGGQLEPNNRGEYYQYTKLTGDFNGDGVTDFAWSYTGSNGFWAFASTKPANSSRLRLITMTSGRTDAVSYGSIVDASLYQKDPLTSFPVVSIQAPMIVASTATREDGVGGSQTTRFFYRGAKVHMQAGAPLGFRQFESTDVSTGVKAVATFRQDFPFQGMPTVVVKNQSSGATLSQTTQTWSDSLYPNSTGKYHRSDLTQSVETGNDLNGAALPTVTTATSYDPWGNAEVITVSSSGFSKTTTNTYSNDTANWFLGRLIRSVVASTSDIPIPPPPPAGGGGGGGSPPPSNPPAISVAALTVILQMMLED